MQVMMMTGSKIGEKSDGNEKSKRFNIVKKMHCGSMLKSNPSFFWNYWKRMVDRHRFDKPDIEHFSIAKISEASKSFLEITHDIRGLSIAAGTPESKVIETYGSIDSYSCMKCRKKFEKKYVDEKKDTPRCDNFNNFCNGILRPDTVLLGESSRIDHIKEAQKFLIESDLIIIAGTEIEFDYQTFLVEEAIRFGKPILYIGENASPFSGNLMNIDINLNVVDLIKTIQVDFSKASSEVISLIESFELIESGEVVKEDVLNRIKEITSVIYKKIESRGL